MLMVGLVVAVCNRAVCCAAWQSSHRQNELKTGFASVFFSIIIAKYFSLQPESRRRARLTN